VTGRDPAGDPFSLEGLSDDPEPDSWVPPVVDQRTPSAARLYDYYLGGKDHYGVDRAAAAEFLRVVPQARVLAWANRGFLERAVDAMTGEGVGQFVDLGSGLPTSPSVSEVARRTVPGARVVAVDNDPIVICHAAALGTPDEHTRTLAADLRDPTRTCHAVDSTGLIDWDRPVGVLLIAVLHFVDAEAGRALIAAYADRLAPGSLIAISCLQREDSDPHALQVLEDLYSRTGTPVTIRTRTQITDLADGLDLLTPGIQDITRWRSRGGPGPVRVAGLVGRKP
jgi:O-methyltransferase involved in polyketide biosynthesis